MKSDEQDYQLNRVAAILLRCFLITAGILLFWYMFYMVAGDWAFNVHAWLFDVTRRDFMLMNYIGMVFVKLCADIFFLIPWIAINLVLRK
jgi:hypothetical protein